MNYYQNIISAGCSFCSPELKCEWQGSNTNQFTLSLSSKANPGISISLIYIDIIEDLILLNYSHYSQSVTVRVESVALYMYNRIGHGQSS